jgi:hypothetical protein
MPDLSENAWMDQQKQRLAGYGMPTSNMSRQQLDFLRSGYQGYQNQQRGERETQSFLNAQEQWYPQLQKGYMDAVRPGLDAAYKQGQTQTALQNIQRGVHRGSQGLQAQAGLSQAFQTNLGQAQQNAARLADSQRQQDLQQAYQQRAGMQGNPYQNMGARGQLQGIQASSQANAMMNSIGQQSIANQQAIQNMYSQLWGQQLQTTGNAVGSFGTSGAS